MDDFLRMPEINLPVGGRIPELVINTSVDD
jgi:hypothetical protein